MAYGFVLRLLAMSVTYSHSNIHKLISCLSKLIVNSQGDDYTYKAKSPVLRRIAYKFSRKTYHFVSPLITKRMKTSLDN